MPLCDRCLNEYVEKPGDLCAWCKVFDPNEWVLPTTRTITLSRDGAVFAVVDADLYDRLRLLGPWSLYEYRGCLYARRTRRAGEWGLGGHGVTVYLHQVVARMVHGPPPTPDHFLVDHRDGDGLNDTGANLRWATPQGNRRNIYGLAWRQPDIFGDQEVVDRILSKQRGVRP